MMPAQDHPFRHEFFEMFKALEPEPLEDLLWEDSESEGDESSSESEDDYLEPFWPGPATNPIVVTNNFVHLVVLTELFDGALRISFPNGGNWTCRYIRWMDALSYSCLHPPIISRQFETMRSSQQNNCGRV